MSNNPLDKQHLKGLKGISSLEGTSSLKGITDCHMHLIGPEQQFPFSAGHAGIFGEWNSDDYLQQANQLGIERCVITQTPFYGFDNRNLLHGLKQMGSIARGIAVIDVSLTAEQFAELVRAGVVGANFYLMEGGELDWSVVAPANERIQEFGWQTQLQFNGRELTDRFQQISALKGRLVVDHIGKFQPSVNIQDPAFKRLCQLLDSGRCYVKLSAPYESSDNSLPYLQQAGSLAQFLIGEYPDQLIWGSNWPHLGLSNCKEWPDAKAALNCLEYWGADSATLEKILVKTPAKLFGFDGQTA